MKIAISYISVHGRKDSVGRECWVLLSVVTVKYGSIHAELLVVPLTRSSKNTSWMKWIIHSLIHSFNQSSW